MLDRGRSAEALREDGWIGTLHASDAASCPKYGGKVCRPEAGALCECYPGKKPSAATRPRRYRFDMTVDEVGQAIDGVASLVDAEHREAAELLGRLQVLYTLAKELEAKPDA